MYRQQIETDSSLFAYLERWPSGRLQVWHTTGGWPLKRLMDAIFALLLCHSPVTSISQKEVYTFIWHPNFVAPLDCLDLVTSRANAVVPQDYIYLHTLKAALRGSDFQVSESRCWLRSSPLGPWRDLAHPQLRGVTKNNVWCLDISKVSEKTAKSGVNDKVHPLHEVTSSRPGDEAVSSNAQKPIQRIKEDEEAEEYVLNENTR